MSNLMITIVIAFGLFILAICLFSISWIIRGKTIIRPGACGHDPTKDQGKSCGTKISCGLCDDGEEDEDDNSLQQK